LDIENHGFLPDIRQWQKKILKSIASAFNQLEMKPLHKIQSGTNPK